MYAGLTLLEPHSRIADNLTLTSSNLSPKQDFGSNNPMAYYSGYNDNIVQHKWDTMVDAMADAIVDAMVVSAQKCYIRTPIILQLDQS